MKNFISIHDISKEEFDNLIKLAIELKREQKAGIAHKHLSGKTLGMIFTKSSTRTRVSFEVGMHQLGGQPLFLSVDDIQIGRGECIEDTARVLSRYLDGIMIRTHSHRDVEMLAEYGSIPIINGLTDLVHPCQVMADLLTVYEHKGKLEGLKMCYVGDGNNMTHSLLHGCAKAGMHMSVATPADYACNPAMVAEAMEDAKETGSIITITTDPEEAMAGADVVYTDTWISMGYEDEKEAKTKHFWPYQVNQRLFAKANDEAIFLHCLPAYRGYEVTADIIDGPNSVIFDEAENRLHAQKAILVTLLGK